MYLGFSSLGFPLPLVESKGEAPHSSHRAGISSVLFSCGNAFILLFFSITPTVLFLSAGREKETKKRARCTLRCRRNVNSKHCAAGLATLKQVLAPPKGAVLSRCISLLHLPLSQPYKVKGALPLRGSWRGLDNHAAPLHFAIIVTKGYGKGNG